MYVYVYIYPSIPLGVAATDFSGSISKEVVSKVP